MCLSASEHVPNKPCPPTLPGARLPPPASLAVGPIHDSPVCANILGLPKQRQHQVVSCRFPSVPIAEAKLKQTLVGVLPASFGHISPSIPKIFHPVIVSSALASKQAAPPGSPLETGILASFGGANIPTKSGVSGAAATDGLAQSRRGDQSARTCPKNI